METKLSEEEILVIRLLLGGYRPEKIKLILKRFYGK